MSVTDNFDRADLATLGADWENAGGADFGIVGNVAKTASGTNSVTRNTNAIGDADHFVEANFPVMGDWCGVMCRMNSANTAGYMFIYRRSTGEIRIQTFDGFGLNTKLGASEFLGTSATLPATLRVEINGSLIKGYINGVEVISRTDSTYTTGDYGGLITWSPTIEFDDFEAGSLSVPTNTISLTSPKSYQVFQRDAQGVSDIVVEGSYTGSPISIEYQYDNGGWNVLDASPSGGSFSGVISGVVAGSQGTLEVRFSNETAVVDSSVYVGVGDVFIVAGQSNAEGRLPAQTYSHATLKAGMYNENSWGELNDPTHAGTSPGSVWPILATAMMTKTGVPVAFICTAVGGTGLESDGYWKPLAGTGYVNLLAKVVASKVNAVQAVLFHQGETDTLSGVTQAAYHAALDLLASSLGDSLTFAEGTKLVVAQLGQRTQATDENLDAVRAAQAEAWDDNANIFAGPVLYDMVLSDGRHFKTNEQGTILSQRWMAAIDQACFDGMAGRGPQLSTVSLSGATITLTFDLPLVDPSQNYDVSAFEVTNDGLGVQISSVSYVTSTTIDITLVAPATGTVLVSFAKGSDSAAGKIVPTGTDSNSLPAEPFYNLSIGSVEPGGEPMSAIAGGVLGVAPVVSEENVITLVRGDTYSESIGRALVWTGLEEDIFPDLTGALVTLTAKRDDEVLSKEGVIVSPTGLQKVRVELTDLESSISTGWWDYDVQATLPNGSAVTLLIGRMHILQDYS